MILALGIPCWLIPILTGLVCGFLGYLLGKSQIKELEENIEKLEGDLNACKKAKVKLEDNLSVVNSTANKESDIEIALKSELEKCKDKASNLETQVSALQSISTPKIDVDQWKNRVSSLEANLKSGHETKAKLDANISDLKAKTTELESKLVAALSVKNEPNKISEDVILWKTKATDLQKELTTTKTKANALERELENMKNSSTQTTEVLFDANAAKAVFGKKIKQDDLTIVEGIGPKIQGLFHDHGVKTWIDLSQCTIEKCQEVLDSGGPRYRIHNPKTWPKQAEFAAKGEWKALKKWQDELDGGL